MQQYDKNCLFFQILNKTNTNIYFYHTEIQLQGTREITSERML